MYSARKRSLAKQILQREKFQSALCRRLQLELRKPSKQAKVIASRIAATTPREGMRGVKVRTPRVSDSSVPLCPCSRAPHDCSACWMRGCLVWWLVSRR